MYGNEYLDLLSYSLYVKCCKLYWSGEYTTKYSVRMAAKEKYYCVLLAKSGFSPVYGNSVAPTLGTTNTYWKELCTYSHLCSLTMYNVLKIQTKPL